MMGFKRITNCQRVEKERENSNFMIATAAIQLINTFKKWTLSTTYFTGT